MKLHGVQLAAGHAAEAERMATDWIKGHPADAAFLYHLGDAALARSDWAAAEARYRAVVELQPRNALALNNVAWLMVKQGRPGAVAVAEKAIALLPDRAPLLDTLATALAAENQVPKAIETQKRAVARSPQDPNLKLNLARLYVKAGDKAYARAELNDLAKLGDKFAAQPEVASLLKSL
jgi:predicted Zn-dependent protease